MFIEQVEVQRPRILLVLGTKVPPLLAPISPDLRCWARFTSYGKMDEGGLSAVPRATLRGSSHAFAAGLLIHPCLSPSNVKHRRYRGLSGAEAETTLITDLVRSSS